MDTSNDESLFDPHEVPSYLLNLAERIQMLEICVTLFRGWDSEMEEIKASSISALARCKESIKEIKNYVKALQPELDASQAKSNELLRLKHKMEYIINNIPDRFNCPASIAQLNSEDEKPNGLKVEAAKTEPIQTNGKQKSVTKIPSILYVTLDEFEKVPKYMKGRVTYEKLNAFIDIINSVISQKYAIFKKKKSTLKKHDADLWNEFYKQELKETKGLFFCVGKDFNNFSGFTLDKMSLNMMTILRHCGRIRELRTGGILRYIVMV